MLRRATAIVLLVCFCLIGSGAVQSLHQLQHAHDDAPDAHSAACHVPTPKAPSRPGQDEGSCVLCLQLRAPLLSVEVHPELVCIGTQVGCVEATQADIQSDGAPVRLDCRGPPAV